MRMGGNRDFPSGSVSKESACNGDPGSIPGSERFTRGGCGHPLLYSCLGNPMNRGAWWATVHGVMSQALTEATEHTHAFLNVLK